MATLLETTLGGGYILNEQGRQDHVANTLPSPYYRFNGTSTDYIVLSAVQALSFSACSFVLWVRREDTSRNDYPFGDTDQSSFQKINFEGTTLYIEGSNNNLAHATGAASDNNWHCYAIVVNNGTVAMYQDGVALTMVDSALVVEDITITRLDEQGLMYGSRVRSKRFVSIT